MEKNCEFRIMVIDDNIDIHSDFIKILTSTKNNNDKLSELNVLKEQLFSPEDSLISLPEFEIDTATQGKEGFERIVEAYNNGNPYALAFVDIRMPPGWDGIETIKNIWSVDKDIQVVICTAYSDYSWEETVTNLGKSDNLLILKKPFDHIAVRQLACALTRKWKLMQDERSYRHSLEERVSERTNSLEKSLSITRATLESSADGIIVVDMDGKIIDYNSKFILMWDIDNQLIQHRNSAEIFNYLQANIIKPTNFFQTILKSANYLEEVVLEILNLTEHRIFECYTQPHKLNDHVIGRVWSFRDVTKRALLEKELKHQATHDALTGLPNRVLLEDRLAQSIAVSKRQKNNFAILFFDLDRFKLINDSLSHAAGDELLQCVAKRISKMIRAEDTLARLGGDEFVIIVPHIHPEQDIVKMAKNLIEKIHEPFHIKGHVVAISTSIGISIYPRDGETVQDLLKNADSAMYHAKACGSDQFQFYGSELNQQINNRFEFELELRQALKNNEFQLFYQPQFEIENNKLVGVEALIRWNHPTKGLLLPIEFVPFAESIGLIIPIGEWVLHNACKQIRAWQDAGFPPIRVAVNITSQQLRQFNIVETIQSILAETGIEPQYLELELTENSIINNPTVIEAINTLKKTGIHIALDDFGSGYSTLNYLRNLSLDRLKIDRSFVQNILINRGDEAIIQAIIDMAKGFNLEVLAEGVENDNQLKFLKDKKCGEIQGFYFSHPLAVPELEDLFKNGVEAYKIPEKENQ